MLLRRVFYIVLLFCSISLVGLANDKIVSLTPAATREIIMLKKAEALVGCSSYGVLPNGLNIRRVGSVVGADIETILKLKPDLVIVSSLMNPNDINKMSSLGLNVVIFNSPKSFDDICNQMLRLANLIDREDLANRIVKRAKRMVFKIKKATEELNKVKVFVQIGANPVFTANKDSFINDFITFAGGINIAANVRNGIYSPAEVIRSNPDAIIISQMGFDGVKQAKRWRQFKFLNAVKNNKILILDDYSLCSPDPLSFAKTLLKIAKFLHPEVDFEKLD